MPRYPVHTLDTAPAASRETLQRVREALGTVPNLAATMAEAPTLVEGFFTLRDLYYRGTLSPQEIQVLSLTNAYENGCRYCMALHSAFALKDGVSEESVAELRAGRSPVEPKLRALSDLSRALVVRRGAVAPEELSAFLAAGYAPAQALEVVLGVGVSTLANFSHHLTEAPIDPMFRPHAWAPPDGQPERATASSAS